MTTGPEAIAALGGKEVTLDEVLRRDPKTVDRERDLKPLVVRLREERAAFIAAGEKRQAKREGVEDTPEVEEAKDD